MKSQFPSFRFFSKAALFVAAGIFPLTSAFSERTLVDVTTSSEFFDALKNSDYSDKVIELNIKNDIDLASGESIRSITEPTASILYIIGNKDSTPILKQNTMLVDLIGVGNLKTVKFKDLTIQGNGQFDVDSNKILDGRLVELQQGNVNFEGNIVVENLYFTYKEYSSALGVGYRFANAGSVVASLGLFDTIELSPDLDKEIKFSNNTVYAEKISDVSASAMGGVIYATGLIGANGKGTIKFESNSVIAKDENSFAGGGALYITNMVYAENGTGATGYRAKEVPYTYGLQLREGNFSFKGNKAHSEVAASGGAIFIQGGQMQSITEEDSGINIQLTFSQNEAKGLRAFGGAISISEEGIATFDKVTSFLFEENKVISDGENGTALGGAIYVNDALFFFAKSPSFSLNSASANGVGVVAAGGAIYMTNDISLETKDAEVSFSNLSEKLVFSKNSVTVDGGTTDAKSTAKGGAISISELSSFFVSSSVDIEFLENKAESKAAGNVLGGAFYLAEGVESQVVTEDISSSNITTTGNIIFSKNSIITSNGEAFGAAIYVDNAAFVLKSNELSFSENKLQGTSATAGTFFVNNGLLEIVTTKINFQGNIATLSDKGIANGAGFSIYNGTANITGDLTFSENKIINQSGSDKNILQGTALYNDAGVIKLKGDLNAENNAIEFKNVNVRASGAAVYLGKNATLSVKKGNFTNNIISQTNSLSQEIVATGGAIATYGKMDFDDAVVFEKNKIQLDNNSAAESFGGALFVGDGSAKFQSANFSENEINSFKRALGGAIYQRGGEMLFNGDVSFAKNKITSATEAAGGAISTYSLFVVNADNISFAENTIVAEKAAGGAIYNAGGNADFLAKSKLSIIANTISDGKSLYGGAIASEGNTKLSIASSETVEIGGIKNNSLTAEENGIALGGAIYQKNGDFTILNENANNLFEISGNTAKIKGTIGTALGGAMYLAGGTHTLKNVNLTNNTATGPTALGGAIYIDASTGVAVNLVLSGNTTISGNTTNSISDGIYIGNGITTVEKSANVSITLNSGKDESVKISDPISIKMTGDETVFSMIKLGVGDFEWAGDNKFEIDGKTSLSVLGGNMILKDGFALNKAFSTITIAENAKLSLEAGTELTFSSSSKIDGVLNVAGVLNLQNAEITMGNKSQFVFSEGASLNILGTNTLSGEVMFNGNVAMGMNASVETSLKINSLILDNSTLTLSKTGTENVSLYIENLEFANNGTIDLGATNAKLGLSKITVSNKENSLGININGSGTIVFYDETKLDGTIESSGFYNSETKELITSNLNVGNDIIIESGLKIGEGIIFSVSNLGQTNYKTILLSGGTLSAAGTTAINPFLVNQEGQKITIDSKGGTLGDGENEQYFKYADTLGASETITLGGNLKIAEKTTLKANISILNRSIALEGEGTLEGSVLEGTSGVIGIAKIMGDVTSKAIYFKGNVEVEGTITNNEQMFFNNGAFVTTSNLINKEGTRLTATNASFKGKFENNGELIVIGTLNFDDNSEFKQSEKGVLDLTSAGSKVDFTNLISIDLNGEIKINAENIPMDGKLFEGLQNNSLDAVQIVNVDNSDYSARFIWDNNINSYRFIGMPNQNLKTTLYGDFQRKGLLRMNSFVDNSLLRTRSYGMAPKIYGANKLKSDYMIEYLKKKARATQSDLEFAPEEKYSDIKNFIMDMTSSAWIQTYGSNRKVAENSNSLSYDDNSFGSLIGFSVPIRGGEIIFGTTLGYQNDKIEHSGENSHKIEGNVYQALVYGRYNNDGYDITTYFSGLYAKNESERKEYSSDFNSWGIGLGAEIGTNLEATDNWQTRLYAGVNSFYSHTLGHTESGDSRALNVESQGTYAIQTKLGVMSSFLLTEEFQFGILWNINADFGPNNYKAFSTSYNYDTETRYDMTSRRYDRFSTDIGTNFSWNCYKQMRIFGEYKYTAYEHDKEHQVSVGLSYSF